MSLIKCMCLTFLFQPHFNILTSCLQLLTDIFNCPHQAATFSQNLGIALASLLLIARRLEEHINQISNDVKKFYGTDIDPEILISIKELQIYTFNKKKPFRKLLNTIFSLAIETKNNTKKRYSLKVICFMDFCLEKYLAKIKPLRQIRIAMYLLELRCCKVQQDVINFVGFLTTTVLIPQGKQVIKCF